MLRKLIKTADRVVDGVVALVCLLLFSVCLYATVDALHVYSTATDTGILKYKPALGDNNAEVLRQLSEDVVAWLTIDGTDIDYPIMQGKTNDTYLNKDPYGDFSLSGSIFLDSRNSADFSDPYSLVYGHHMEHGAMFGALDAFKDKTYFSQHRTGILMTASGENYNISLFACCTAPANDSTVFEPTQTTQQELVSFLQENASILEAQPASPEAKILALSTCQAADTIDRLILFGTLEEVSV